MLRRLASLLPNPLISRLNALQFRHRRMGQLLGYFAARVARGEGVIGRGAAKGLRIDASGRNAGYLLGTSDLKEQEWLTKHLRPGDAFYDVGANIGFFTLIGARLVGQRGTVAAFEPLPVNLGQLRRNVALNGLDHVTVVSAAVAAHDGIVRFGSPEDRRDNARILHAEDESPRSIDVPAVTIDAWRAETGTPEPTVMKIDVEGAEIDVLRGAMQTIRRHKPMILVEVHWLGKPFADYMSEAILPLGYSTKTIEGDQLPSAPVRCHVVLTPNFPADKRLR